MKPTIANELDRMLEPLANYICATGQPRTVLMSALARLFDEVEQTNRAASLQINKFSEPCRHPSTHC